MVVPNSNNLAIKSGISLFLAGAGYSLIAKRYSHISSCSTKAQIGAFAIAGVAQFFVSKCFLEDEFSPPRPFLKGLSFVILTGFAIRKCGFEAPVLKTIVIALSSFGMDWISRRNRRDRYVDVPERQRPEIRRVEALSLQIEEPITLSADEFKRLLYSQNLPNSKIFVTGKLDFNGCHRLTSLPDDLCIGGSLNLNGCINLISLPKNLCVGKNLNAKDCISLTSLSEGICVGTQGIQGKLNLSGCNSLNYLPLNIYVGGDLLLSNCTNLISLPNGLRVGRNWDLNWEDYWTPEGFHVGKSRNWDRVSKNWKQEWDHNWRDLTSLPQGLALNGNLLLNGCHRLTSLPDDLCIGGSLNLNGCINLISLPEDLCIGGSLNLNGCINLISLPEDLCIGGSLNLSVCIRVTSVPNWITALGPCTPIGMCSNPLLGDCREVNLTGTGLSDAIIDRLRDTPAPGMRFIFGRQAAAVDERVFNDLNRSIHFWCQIVQRRDLPRLNLQGDAGYDMTSFLARLANTAEYRNSQTRNPLAIRVLNMLDFFNENEALKILIIDTIHRGLESCDDRVIATLDDVELLKKIHDAEEGSPSQEAERKLRQLGTSIYKLEEVRRYARSHMARLQWVDEVEVQLAYQIGLTQPLGLPLSTQNMLYRGCAGVSDQEINLVGQRILAECTQGRVDQFLASWDPWIRHTRRKSIPSYEDIPMIDPLPANAPVQCQIMMDETAQPIRHNQNIFDYDAFCRCYIENGKNPCTNLEISWNDVRRLRVV